jgi:hypothetical protein
MRTHNCVTEEEAIEAWNTRADGWIAVEDALPETIGPICACIKGFKESVVAIYYCESKEFKFMGSTLYLEPTHWQPLPTPPKGTQ